MRSNACAFVVGFAMLCLGLTPVWASSFTPLEWQQRVEKHGIASMIDQRKHLTWTRDRNRNFIDDEIEARFRPGELVNVVVDLNACWPQGQIRELLSKFGRIAYVGKLITFVLLNDVRFERLSELAALPQVAMVEWQVSGQVMNDVGARTVQSRASNTFSPNTAQDAGFTGNGVTVAILDTGVDENHESLSGKFVAGFHALRFEDTNGNGVDDSCEPAPLGNGSCTDADDEPADGTTNPADDNGHGTHVAGTAVGAGATGRTCSTPDDGSVTNCAGVAAGARLVDIKVCNAAGVCSTADVAEGLDWLGIHARSLNIRVANISLGFCTDDDGTSAMAKQVNYVVALGVVAAVAHGNASNCGLAGGTVRTMFPGSSSLAITAGATNDRNTVGRNDDTNYTQFLRGPRMDFNVATPNLLALKPDLSAPGENIVSAQRNTTAGYVTMSGTSMASPHVAGAAAVVLQARSAMDPGSLKHLLKQQADTALNTAQFPAVDPNWDNDLGSGMLNVWGAVHAAATMDVGFPNCSGPPAAPGQPCALPAPNPSWNNTVDLTTASAPKVSVANTIHAQVRNHGATPATVLVNFGVYVFAVGNNQFFHIGAQPVTIPGNTTVPVNQAWTPAATNHQCIQVTIEFGLDTNFNNNVTQRNLQVAPSVYEVRIENPFMVPAEFRIQPKSRRDGWRWRVSETSFTLHPFLDCPRTVRIEFDAPAEARPGERADLDVAVVARAKGDDRERLIGGVTVQTYVPEPCLVVGVVVDEKGKPVSEARVTVLKETETKPPLIRPVAVITDKAGVFSVQLAPHSSYKVTVERKGVGKGEATLRPDCSGCLVKLVLGREGLKLAEPREAGDGAVKAAGSLPAPGRVCCPASSPE